MKKMNENGITIFLNTSLEILIERISRKNIRPLFKSTNVKEKVNKIFDERIKFYKQSKHSIINNDRKKALSIINSYS